MKNTYMMTIAMLLGSSAAVFAADERQAFFDALKKHDLDTVRALVGKGASVTSKDESGYTPLATAISYFDRDADIDIIKLLVDKGALKNDPEGARAALTQAIFKGNYQLVHLLLDNKVDVLAESADGSNPLVLARSLESRNPDKFYAIRSLIEKFVDAQRTDAAKGMKAA